MFIGGISIFVNQSNAMVITAYAQGTDEEITSTGIIMNTGTISDTGEMKGHPLMFYISGKDIATVRFSCKNQQIDFRDWTEKREEYGNAQNFTVTYGEDESEYYYLTIDWVPNTIIRELTDNKDCTISTLPEEMRSDIIVMEITFSNGKIVNKAIEVSLLDDGTFFATFDDYKISDADTFVNRPDSKAIPRDVLYKQGDEPIDDENSITDELSSLTTEQIEEAKQAALDYYANTVFEVNAMNYIEVGSSPFSEGDCNFSVNVSKDGVVQEPDRIISLKKNGNTWEIVGEGY
jgi:uncharacterized protein YkuJ